MRDASTTKQRLVRPVVVTQPDRLAADDLPHSNVCSEVAAANLNYQSLINPRLVGLGPEPTEVLFPRSRAIRW